MVRVAFIHPDLGIGGAERAIVDAALSLQNHKHQVSIVTAHHDPSHCFEETKDGRLKVVAVGDWLPRSFFGSFSLLFAILRNFYCAIFLLFFSDLHFDVIFCDQISACIAIFKFFSKKKVLFYCHFPDLLLTEREGFLKSIYRAPFDWLEGWTTGLADVILVNSKFTGEIFRSTFPSLKHRDLQVIYPIPDFSSASSSEISNPLRTTFLSINRYERKKNHILAVKALKNLKYLMNGCLGNVHLVIAGGYDSRVKENIDCHLELKKEVEKQQLQDHVTFHKSISSQFKYDLLNTSTCLLYTPQMEHFGIVPIEAMYFRLPVIAVNKGGPMETVVDMETGFLCKPFPEEFAKKMKLFVDNPMLRKDLGKESHKRVLENFTFQVFGERLHKVVEKLAGK